MFRGWRVKGGHSSIVCGRMKEWVEFMLLGASEELMENMI